MGSRNSDSKVRRFAIGLMCLVVGLWAMVPFAVWAFDAIIIIEDPAAGPLTSDVEAFSFTNKNLTDLHAGGGAGQSTFSDVSVVKLIDKATPLLSEAVAKGQVFPKVEIHVLSNDPKAPPVYRVEMEDVIIREVNPTGGLTEIRESVSFQYTKVKWYYEDTTDSTSGGWDVQANKAY